MASASRNHDYEPPGAGDAGGRRPLRTKGVKRRPTVPPSTGRTVRPIDGRYDLAGWYLMGKIFRLRRTLPRDPPRLVDLGMGRGRDILYFARRGFRVLGIDWSPAAVERAVRRARRLGVHIDTRVQDLRTSPVRGPFEVVYSSCFLNHLPRAARRRRIAEFQAATSAGGIHAVNAFVREPRPGHREESDPYESPLRRGELRSHYRGWEILESGVVPFRCLAPGPPHEHHVDVIVARKPVGQPVVEGPHGRRPGTRHATISHRPYKTKRPRAATKRL